MLKLTFRALDCNILSNMKNLEYDFERTSYWNDTTCIRSNNLDLVEQTLTHILEKEGYRLIPKPPLPQNSKLLIQELLSSSYKVDSYLWVIGLNAGNLGWTIIKTSITELFCRRAKGNTRPRLSELSMHNGCDAFHLSVHNRYWGVLLEANAFGQTQATGYLDQYDVKNMQFYDEPVKEPKSKQNFFLIDVPEEFHAAGRRKVNLSKEEKQGREEELETLVEHYPEYFARALTEWRELNMGGYERMDEDLGQLLCNSHPHFYYLQFWQGNKLWHEKNILHKAYTEPEQLEKDGVRLLFFQVGQFHLNPNTEEIWSPITSREDYGKDPWQEIPF